MLFAGIDVGSKSTDAVIINERLEIVSFSVVETGAEHREAAKEALYSVCTSAHCDVNDLDYVVGTGYGRKNINITKSQFTEISCHAKGAYLLFPDATTVIDIGGQDSKVISLGENGVVKDFLMNEKCAAGTGRFIEAMAKIMQVEVDEMGPLSLEGENGMHISSVCTVFAESEVISKIALGGNRQDIIVGIHNSACDRVIGMVRRLGQGSVVVMTGGVAKNCGMVTILENRLQTHLRIPDDPQIVGALGAAYFGWEKKNNNFQKASVL